MNNNINIANTGHIKPSTTATVSVVETNPQGIDGTKSYHSADKTNLFHDTIQKQHRDAASNNSNENNKSSGKNLPKSESLSGIAETNGRSTSHSTATENSDFASNTQNTSNQSALVTTGLDNESSITNDAAHNETHNPLLAPALTTQTTSVPTSQPMAGSLSVAVSAAAASTDNSKLDINNEQKMSSNPDSQDSTISAVLNDTLLANVKVPASELNKTSLATATLTNGVSDKATSEAHNIITSSHDSIKNIAVETNATAKTVSTVNPGNINGTSALQTQYIGNNTSGRDLAGRDLSGQDLSGNASPGNTIAGNTIAGSAVQESSIKTTRPVIETAMNDEPANKASPVNILHPSNMLSTKADPSPKPASGSDIKQPHIIKNLQAQESVRSVQDNIIETVKVMSLNNNVDDKINIMPSQISQLIKAELHTDTHNTTTTEKPTATTTTNVSPLSDEYITTTSSGLVSSGMEKPSLQTTNTSSINMQFTESMADKNQLLTSIQSSLLLPTATNKGEVTGDGLPVITNTATNTATATLSSANSIPISQLLSTPQNEINEPFGRATWSQAMGKQVLMMINQNIGSAEIRLNPANLGPIEIQIDMSEDQVNVAMSSRHAIVREAMEQALPRLREMLDDNGFNLADADVSQHSFAEQREQNSNANNPNILQQSNEQMLPIAINESTLQQTAATDSTVDYYI